MAGEPQELVDELRRAIAQTPDSAEQRALLAKLAVLERALGEFMRQQREVEAADAQLARAKSDVFVWRVVIGILVAALIGVSGWLIADMFHWF
jgi:hypothetical protein